MVDASQGIEAQTLANVYQAMDLDLEIIGVLNKIDLPNAEPEQVVGEMGEILGLVPDEIISVSAKMGQGIEGVLEAAVAKIPAPKGNAGGTLQALIFDLF